MLLLRSEASNPSTVRLLRYVPTTVAVQENCKKMLEPYPHTIQTLNLFQNTQITPRCATDSCCTCTPKLTRSTSRQQPDYLNQRACICTWCQIRSWLQPAVNSGCSVVNLERVKPALPEVSSGSTWRITSTTLPLFVALSIRIEAVISARSIVPVCDTPDKKSTSNETHTHHCNRARALFVPTRITLRALRCQAILQVKTALGDNGTCVLRRSASAVTTVSPSDLVNQGGIVCHESTTLMR